MHPLRACVYQERCRSLVETLEESRKFANLYNWQCAGAELATCTARVEGRQAGPRACALLHKLHHYALRVKIWRFQPQLSNCQI